MNKQYMKMARNNGKGLLDIEYNKNDSHHEKNGIYPAQECNCLEYDYIAFVVIIPNYKTWFIFRKISNNWRDKENSMMYH